MLLSVRVLIVEVVHVPFYLDNSSDVVWELKPKKKNRWKTLSTKETEMLESSFKEYTESGPSSSATVELENGYQVSD